MPGFSPAYRKGSGSAVLEAVPCLIGKSTTIQQGDVLIKTNVSARNGSGVGGPAVVRPLFSGDTVATTNGLFGVAAFGIQTDANGNITTLSSPVNVDTRGKLDTNNMLLNILPLDPASGFVMIWCWSFDDENVFEANAKNTEIVNFYDLGRPIGIFCSNSGPPSNYQVTNTLAAANAPLLCDGVDTENPLYNSSASGVGAVMFVTCANAFQQAMNQNMWTT